MELNTFVLLCYVLLWQNTTDCIVYINGNLLAYSSGGWEVQYWAADIWWGPSCCIIAWWKEEGQRECNRETRGDLIPLCKMAVVPAMKASGTDHCLKVSSLNTVKMAINFNLSFGEDRHSNCSNIKFDPRGYLLRTRDTSKVHWNFGIVSFCQMKGID